jgi:Lar family restriction alleviation protein
MQTYKPCPFCGEEDCVLEYKTTSTEQECWVECNGCGARASKSFSQKTAQQKWNRRIHNTTHICGDAMPHSGANRVGRTGVMIYKTNRK